MSQSHNTSQTSSISWAVDELKIELNQVLRILETYSKNSGKEDSLTDCVQCLEQVTSIFSIVNMVLPQSLCEELQSSIKDYASQTGSTATATLGVVTESILQLSNFLDSPNRSDRLIPQINNLRALTKRELFTESSAFEINLESGFKTFNRKTDQRLDSQTIRKLRMLYQRSVLNLIKEGTSTETITGLQKSFKILYQMGGTPYLSATGYAGLALIERLQSNHLDMDLAVQSQFKRLDDVLRKLISGTDYEDTGLLKNIVYYVAIGSEHSALATKLINIFALGRYSEDNLNRNANFNVDSELASKVVDVLHAEIEQAKTWFDDCLHGVCEFPEAVSQMDTILKRVEDTLVMVNANQPRASITSLQTILDEWKSLESKNLIDSDTLDDFANSMVQLEYRLKTLSRPYGSSNDSTNDSANDSEDPTGVDNAKDTILSESRIALTQVKASITQFIDANWQWVALREVPSILAMIEGALRFYPLEDLAKVIHCVRRYVREALLEKREVPGQTEINLFADAVVAVDYYLECLEEGSVFNLDGLIIKANENCAQLGFVYQEITENQAGTDPLNQSQTSAERSGADTDTTEGEDSPFNNTSQFSDDRIAPALDSEDQNESESNKAVNDDFKIIEIFVEEANQILLAAIQQAEEWKSQQDTAALLDLRRGFYTLKGGGRMIGAPLIGELSWAIENMLNRIIDNSVEITPEVHELVEGALQQYPTLLKALSTSGSETSNEEVQDIQNRVSILSDPLAAPQQSIDPATENSELTNTFISEAETLRKAVVSITGAENNNVQDISEPLIKTLHTLSDSARMAEFNDLADSFTPFQELLQHYNSTKKAPSNDFIALLSIWAGKFDETLHSIKRHGSFEIGPIEQVALSASELLQTKEKILSDDPSTDRKKRFMPLHRLMSGGLDKLIIAEQILSNWAAGQHTTDDLDQLSEDLSRLQEAAEICKINELSELCLLISEIQTELAGEETLVDTCENWLQHSYELLLEMLDALASWQVIPKIPVELIDSKPDTNSAPESAPKIDFDKPKLLITPENTGKAEQEEVNAPVEIEPDTPIAEKIGFDRSFLDSDDAFQQELLDTFLEEADVLVQNIDTSISSWRRDPTAFSNADLIHRALHTLKGGARLSGLTKLGDQSHEFESFIIDQQVLRKADEHFFNRALEWLDLVNAHIETIREARLIGGTIHEIAALTAEKTTFESSAHEENYALQIISAEELAPSNPAIEEAASLTDQIEKTTPEFSEPKPEFAKRSRQELIRLHADTVEEMVNLSNETTVYNGQVEAQLTGLNTNLDELEATIGRVQQLARRLGTETEAQIQFRSEQLAEAGEESDFDPLEMDRYSTLQQLSRQLIESVSDLQDLRGTLSDGNRDASALLVQNGRIQSELNSHLMRTRMVPFERVLPRLERIVRQVCRELDKKADLRALDISGELDRQVLEQLVSPIEHILRNSIDHGIEDSATRKQKGKPRAGRITINLRREGSFMVLTLTDDGAGIDFERIRARAVERGMVNAEQAKSLTENELGEILFTAGFSTAETVTQISGRGVGMDVVRSIIREMGGHVSVRSEIGRGSEFTLSIPFTLSVNRALMVHVGEDTYALPLASLEALVRLTKADLETYYENPSKKLEYGIDEYEFGYLGEMLKTLERPQLDTLVEPTVSVVLFRAGNHRVALLVDEIIGSHEVVVKSLSPPFSSIPGLSGAAIMGNGSVIVTLDMPTLISSYYASGSGIAAPIITETLEKERTPIIMVVDDSVTVRKVTSRFLNREGFIVETARDGIDALRLIHDQMPDLMLVDVEMPRMDGFELLDVLRSTEKFKDLPVVLITSRTGEKHQQRGLSLGAQNYFGKPYREDLLLEEIKRLLPGEKT